MRNEEMETHLRAKPWVMLVSQASPIPFRSANYWQKINRQSQLASFHGFGNLACKTIQLINGWHLWV